LRCAETVGPKPLRRFITPKRGVFDQVFLKKACVAPFDHVVFDQTFFEKVCDQAFFEKVCGHAFFKKG
jgi:hypothetical protein